MLENLKRLLFDQNAKVGNPVLDNSGTKLAEAALMFHVIAADGVVTDSERDRMKSVLQTRFNLSQKDTGTLVKQAREADLEAIDLFGFTSTLREQLDYDERLTIIRNLWEMVFADGELHELEDNVVWRVADLLDVDGRDRVLLKQEVRAEYPKSPDNGQQSG